jgi:hypothetical protein
VSCEQWRHFGEALAVQRLDRLGDAPVECPPLLYWRRDVCDLMRERVLERVLDVGKEPPLVDEPARGQLAEGLVDA